MDVLKNKSRLMTFAATLLISGSAFAIVPETGTKTLSSIIGVSSPNLSVTFKQGTAIVSGSVDSNGEVQLILSHVANMEGVNRVINLITTH